MEELQLTDRPMSQGEAWGPLAGEIRYELHKQAMEYQVGKVYRGVVVEEPNMEATFVDLMILDRLIHPNTQCFLVSFKIGDIRCIGVAYIAWSHFCHSGLGDKINYGTLPLIIKGAPEGQDIVQLSLEDPEHRKMLAISVYYEISGKKGTTMELAKARLWGRISKMNVAKKIVPLPMLQAKT